MLGVDPTAPDEAVRAGHDALAARNRQRRHDRLRTVTDELLVLADRYAAGPGRARYQATMVAEARRQLTPDIEAMLLVDDRVGAVDFEHLVRQAVALRARRRPAPAGGHRHGRRTGRGRRDGTGGRLPAVPGLRGGRGGRGPAPGVPAVRHRPLPVVPVVPPRDRGVGLRVQPLRRRPAGAGRGRAGAPPALGGGRAAHRASTASGPSASCWPTTPSSSRRCGCWPPPRRRRPSRVEAEAGAGSIIVRWTAERVARGHRLPGDPLPGRRSGPAGGPDGRVDLEDAGAPRGTVRYEIVAIRRGPGVGPRQRWRPWPPSTSRGSPPRCRRSRRADLEGTRRGHGVDRAHCGARSGGTAGSGDSGPDWRRAGAGGALTDTDVEPGLAYRYRVSVEYPPAGGRPSVPTPGVTTAVSVPVRPDRVRLVADVSDREIRLRLEPAAVTTGVRVVRRGSPPPAAGTPLAPAALDALGPSLPRGSEPGTAVDLLAGGPRWYVPVREGDEGAVVAGRALGHPGLAPVGGLTVEAGDGHLLVRWDWPRGAPRRRCSGAALTVPARPR